MDATMNATGLIGGGVVLLILALLVMKYFPEEISRFLNRSESSIKKQSEEMLAEMDRNIAERKARHGR